MVRGIGIVFPLALGAIAVAAAAAGHGDHSPPRPVATVTSGSFELENSRDDMPIFAASDIGPVMAPAARSRSPTTARKPVS